MHRPQNSPSFDWRQLSALPWANIIIVTGAAAAASLVLYGVVQSRKAEAEPLPDPAPSPIVSPSPVVSPQTQPLANFPTTPQPIATTTELQTVQAPIKEQQYSVPTAGYQEVIFSEPIACVPGVQGKLLCFPDK